MRRHTGLTVLALGMLLLAGCWNRRELNDLSLVVGMSIDKSEDGYKVAVQVVDPGEIASQHGASGRTPVTVYTETSKHIFEAVRKMTKTAPRRLYFSHLQMLVISEEIAKEGISKPLEFLSRDHEFREDFFVAVSRRSQALEILENLTSIEKIPANKMSSSLQTSQKVWAPTVAVSLDELIMSLSSDGKHSVLTGITLLGDKSKSSIKDNVERTQSYARLHYEGIAVFKKDKLIGWLDETESKGYNYITNQVKSTVGSIACPDGGDLALEIIRSKSRIKGRMEDGKPVIDVKIYIESNVGEVFCQADLTDPDTIRKLEEIGHRRNEDIVKSAVKKAKQLKTDIFGFGEVIHRSDPQQWKTIKKDWDDYFARAEVRVETDLRIRRTGTVNRPFMKKEEE